MYVIWHNNDYDFARWVYLNSDLSKLKDSVIIRPIPKTNKKSTILALFDQKTDFDILPAIKYDTPDIIIQYIDEKRNDSKILIVTEFMTHTPQHHHPLQRFSRIYGSSELKLPTVLVLPNSKIKLERKNGTYKPTKYKTNPLIYHIFLRTSKINGSPTLIFWWPDYEGYLKNDKKHPTAPFINEQIARWFYLLNLTMKHDNIDYTEDHEIKKQVKLMVETSKYIDKKQTELNKNWNKEYKLKTIAILPTSTVIKKFNLDQDNLPECFKRRSKTLVFTPMGLNAPSSPFRTDPYAGMLCAFDNLFCKGENGFRNTNLVLRAKNVSYGESLFEKIKHNKETCPFLILNISQKIDVKKIKEHLENCPFTKTKQQRIYGQVADIIIFDDFVYFKSE